MLTAGLHIGADPATGRPRQITRLVTFHSSLVPPGPMTRVVGLVDYSLLASFVDAQRRNYDVRAGERVRRKDVVELLDRIAARAKPANVRELPRDDR